MLRGRFVLLRPLSRDDAGEMRALVATSPRETFQWTTVPTPETVEQYIEAAVTAMERGEALAYATCRATGEPVGSTRFFDFQRWSGPRLDACEIGHTWLAQAAQRTPINTEAKLLMLQHAFETWACARVTLKTDERNARSRAAIGRLGAHFDGILRAAHPAVDGQPRNTAYFSILSTEWPTLRTQLLAKLTT